MCQATIRNFPEISVLDNARPSRHHVAMARIRQSIDVPEEIVERLSVFVQRGYIKQDVITAAIRLILTAPPALREMALAGDDDAIAHWFDGQAAEDLTRHVTDALRRAEQRLREERRARDQKAGGSKRGV